MSVLGNSSIARRERLATRYDIPGEHEVYSYLDRYPRLMDRLFVLYEALASFFVYESFRIKIFHDDSEDPVRSILDVEIVSLRDGYEMSQLLCEFDDQYDAIAKGADQQMMLSISFEPTAQLTGYVHAEPG